ncbi:LuxR C-terminal-related transcriptional regulator [Rhodococcus sp. NPDC058521]|uniref:helix-turn-helix transcriptional regulator n=1 Tax=Rhodococcus sp. NPDC058521 TaxID=3346536 RepID=UPI003651BAA2
MSGGWPLAGRAEELVFLENALSGNKDYAGAVISGQSGVGKSRLAREALTSAESRGLVVRWAVATESARTIPLGTFAEWASEPHNNMVQLVRGVIDALTDRLAAAEVVVGVDDAHLLDDMSAFVLHQLVLRRAAKVIITIRSGEPVPDAVRALWKDHHVEILELQALSESESAELVSLVLGGPVAVGAARRLWKLTRGNLLYLRMVVDHERAVGRFRREGDFWNWVGGPVASASLVELIECRIGDLPPHVAEVLDMLAVGEPLEIGDLERLTSSVAVEDADTRGLLAISPTDTGLEVRVAHPLYAEVRRARIASTRMRRLRGIVANTTDSVDGDDPRRLVRRAALMLDSDLPAEPALFTAAAARALWLADPALADRLAAAAIDAGAGPEAGYIRAHTLSWLDRGQEADAVLRSIPTAGFGDSEKARHVFLQATNLLWTLRRPEDGKNLVDEAMSSCGPDGMPCLSAFHALYWTAMGWPQRAIDAAQSIDLTKLSPVVAAVTSWALVVAHGEAGHIDEAVRIVRDAFGLVEKHLEAARLRFVLADAYVDVLVMAGRNSEAHQVACQLQEQAMDLPGDAQVLGDAVAGHAALGTGDVSAAQQLLTRAVDVVVGIRDANGFGYRYQLARAQAMAMAGHPAAYDALEDAGRRHHPSWGLLDPAFGLTRAWVAAARGVDCDAISAARSAATLAAERGQFAWEVVCLQAATQFGDRTTAHRCAELTSKVRGPRAPAVADYSAALASADASALQGASILFENIGDRVAAADAAAQATVAYARQQKRGSASISAARAARLSAECGGISTPATREAAHPSPLTSREREVVSLLTLGLTNRQIAERLTLSVRTVEGHLYQAAAKTGAANRAELAAIISGE